MIIIVVVVEFEIFTNIFLCDQSQEKIWTYLKLLPEPYFQLFTFVAEYILLGLTVMHTVQTAKYDQIKTGSRLFYAPSHHHLTFLFCC